MNFLFHTAIGVNREMAHYKFSMLVAANTSWNCRTSHSIIRHHHLEKHTRMANCQPADELIAQYVGEEIEQYLRTHS